MENYELIRSGRKTLAVEITKDGRVVVRAPLRMSQQRIEDFVAGHQDWIARHVAAQKERLERRPAPEDGDIPALRARAEAVLPQKVEQWSRRTGLVPTGVKITAAKRRFGSCNARNGLCFSCFLMNYPEPAIDLVVVHELCHIREKNHGPRFYALLEGFLPDHKERKKLLR